MIATIRDNHWIYISHITEPEEDILWTEFSVARPGTYVDPAQRGHWDGIYRKYNRAKRRLARPLLAMLRNVCQNYSLPLTVVDQRKPWPYAVMKPDEITADFMPGIILDHWQVKAIRRGIQVECGIFDIPTGGGKGELIAGLCKAIQCPTVILAEQRVVIDQLKERLELRDVADEIGVFYAGRRPDGELVVVGSVQSLMPPSRPPQIPQRRPDESDAAYDRRMKKWDVAFKTYKTRRANARTLQEYVRKAEMLIVDECDRATSELWRAVFRNYFCGRRRYGFSGTPIDPDKPVEAMVMQEHLGSIIFRETREHLTRIGRIIPCEYYSLALGCKGSINEASAYDIAVNEFIVENEDFHLMIAKLCQKCKRQADDGTLILVDRELLGHKLTEAISRLGMSCEFIFGKTTQRRRDEVLRAFERRELDVLIGGKIINRGLDLKGGCENLIIATGGKLQSAFIQKVGRALRHNRRGKSKIYDFFFRCNRYLYRHSKARLKAMLNAGYRTTVVFPGGSIDGVEFVKGRFRVKHKLLMPRLRAAPSS